MSEGWVAWMLWPCTVLEFSSSSYDSTGQWTFYSLLSSGACSADTQFVMHELTPFPKQNACTNSQALGLLDVLICISLVHYGIEKLREDSNSNSASQTISELWILSGIMKAMNCVSRLIHIRAHWLCSWNSVTRLGVFWSLTMDVGPQV